MRNTLLVLPTCSHFTFIFPSAPVQNTKWRPEYINFVQVVKAIFNQRTQRVEKNITFIFFYYVDKMLAQNKLDIWRNGVINIFTSDDIKIHYSGPGCSNYAVYLDMSHCHLIIKRPVTECN